MPDNRQIEEVRRELGSRLITRAEEFYDIPQGSITHPKRRNGNVSKARWALAFVLVGDAGWTQDRVGDLIAKDHKAIGYGLKQARLLLRSCPIFFEAVRLLKEQVAPNDGSHLRWQ